jgi:hypothetical protein
MAHPPLKGSERDVMPGAQVAGKANPTEWLEVSLILRCPRHAALKERVEQL